MGEVLRNRLRVARFESDIQEALLNVMVAAGHVREMIDRACAEFGITAAQYNVLRILKGGPPEGYSRREILERMIERAPDCTRLIDRLERQNLVSRTRTKSDRRLSLTRITAEGSKLLDRMAIEIDRIQAEIGSRLSAVDRRELSRILEMLYNSNDHD